MAPQCTCSDKQRKSKGWCCPFCRDRRRYFREQEQDLGVTVNTHTFDYNDVDNTHVDDED